jgi:hypothetical protein
MPMNEWRESNAKIGQYNCLNEGINDYKLKNPLRIKGN